MTTTELGEYMREHHAGVANAEPNRVIAQRLGFDDLGTNGREHLPNSGAFTELCNQALEEGIPIIPGPDGYFYALNRSEFDHFIHHAEALIADWTRKLAAAIRARGLVHNDFLFDQ